MLLLSSRRGQTSKIIPGHFTQKSLFWGCKQVYRKHGDFPPVAVILLAFDDKTLSEQLWEAQKNVAEYATS